MKKSKHYYVASLKVGDAVVLKYPADTKWRAWALALRQKLSVPDHFATEITVQKHFYETAPMEKPK